MPAPLLLTRDGQYEFNSLLMNDNSSEADTLRVEKVEGLFDIPDSKVTEVELQDDHGGTIGRELLTMRRITMDLAVRASNKSLLYTKLRAIEDAFQPQTSALPLFFQRAGIGLMFVYARPRRLGGFDTGYLTDTGFVRGSVQFVCPDPRKFSATDSSSVLTIASGGLTVNGNVNPIGNFNGGHRPVLEIDGPVTNPRIANAADGGRSIKIDMVINAGQKLIIDVATRSVTMGGVDYSSSVRSDNQWWVLKRGVNTLTFSRSNSPANTGVLTVKWNAAYV